MARPREFDRDKALEDAMLVFWAKGYAATSTDDLLQAMGIGRQSLYNAFGDKRGIYIESLAAYLQRVNTGHLTRLTGPASPLEGVLDLLLGLMAEDDRLRGLGCMGVCSVAEFGSADADVACLRDRWSGPLSDRLAERIRQGQAGGEIDPTLDPSEAAGFVQTAMSGLQVAARAGAGPEALKPLAAFIVDRLRAR